MRRGLTCFLWHLDSPKESVLSSGTWISWPFRSVSRLVPRSILPPGEFAAPLGGCNGAASNGRSGSVSNLDGCSAAMPVTRCSWLA